MRRTRVRPALEVLEERRVPAALIVDTTADNNVRDGDLSLREAVALVNGTLALGGLTAQEQAQVSLARPRQLPGRPRGQTAQARQGQPLGTNDTIVFAPSLAGRTIALTLDDPNRAFGPTALALTSSMTIDGTGAPGLTIDGTGTHRTFAVGAGASVILTNLTLTGGRARGGNGGSAVSTKFNGGAGGGAAGMGGAIYSIGTLSIRGVTFSANTAQGGNGGTGQNSFSGESGGSGGGGGVGGNGGDFTGDGASPGGGGGGVGGSGGADGTGGANENGVQAEPVAAGTLGGGGGGGNGGYGTDLSSGGFGGGGGGGGGDGGFGSGGGGTGLDDAGDGGFGGGGGGSDGFFFGGGGFGGGDGGADGSTRSGGGGAGMGGAIFNNGGTLTIVNSTFTANVAQAGSRGGDSGAMDGAGLGGAIFSRNGTMTLTNVTISGNTAAQGGRGIYIVGQDATATAVLINTILGQADNSVSDFDSAAINDGSVSTAGSTNNLVRNNGDGLAASAIVSSADPRLAALAHNGGPTPTMALLAGSPARNAGSIPAAIGLATDQRGAGFPRIVDGSVDLGAFETQPGLVSGFGRGRDAFVATLYRDNLGRLLDLATLKSLSRRLAAGAPPRQVVRSIWGGAEHQRLVKEGLVAPLTFRQAYVHALRAGWQAARLRRPPSGPLSLTVNSLSS